MTQRVLVVGAGPTGLSTALRLASLGVVPEVVERRTEPSQLSRAVGILPESIEKLSHAGVGEAICSEAVEIRKINLHREQKPLMNLDFSGGGYDGPVVRGLPQNRTEEIIANGFVQLGGAVRYGCEVTDIKLSDHQAEIELDGNETKTYDWVVAADGVQSRIRQGLNIAYPGFDLDDEWSVADAYVSGYDTQSLTAWVQKPPGEFVFVIPIEESRVRLASSTSNVLEEMSLPFEVAEVRRSGTFRISVRQAETYRKGCVLLAGDAAHCHSPVGGRGMNLGIDDAIACAEAIVGGEVESYSQARHSKGQQVMEASERGRKVVCGSGVGVKFLTTVVTSMIHYLPPVRNAFLRMLTSL
ncbi:MAG: NAD(P)/FAD-dependent oxidoreductase [Pseudomonadota bacterium]